MEELNTSASMATESAAAPAEQGTPSETPANFFGFAPESDPVGGDQEAAQAGEEAPAPESNGATEAEAPDGVDGRKPGKQKEIGHAFSREKNRLKREYEQRMKSDPDRLIGRRLLEDLMARESLTEDKAREVLEQRYAEAYAKRENVGEGIARDIARLKKQLPTDQPNEPDGEEFDPGARAEEIRNEIGSMELPEGFEPEEAYADPAFAELVMKYPTEAAVRIYTAERRAANAPKDIAEKLRARNQIPQSERSSAPVTPNVNYMSMTSEEFFAEKARREKAMR